MPELLRVQTAQFEFSIWCNDIAKRQQVYQATLLKRASKQTQAEQKQAIDEQNRLPIIRFSPPLLITEVSITEVSTKEGHAALTELTAELVLDESLFFENVQYQFEWVFFEPVEEARLTHRSRLVNEGFRFVKAHRSILARLTGTINTGNNVGWMRLPLEYVITGQTIKSHVSFEVLPTKMDLHRDLPAMYQSIDEEFPLWRFSLVEKTEQDTARSQQRGHFPLLWLANFGHLRKRFEQGLKVITQAPHSRLQPHVSYTKAERLKGRLPHQLGTKVKEDFANGHYDKRYRVEKKQRSVDTPENCFIKMVVSTCKKRLAGFENKLRQSNQAPDKQRLSDAFLDELHNWQQPLQKILGQSFLKDVGCYAGLSRESLVLQQKTGYSAVYRVWQELKFYLDVFANQSSVSMKSVAEIYEVWCFLQFKTIFEEELGFKLQKNRKAKLNEDPYWGHKLINADKGAFEFNRNDGIRVNLYHERAFARTTTEIRTFLLTHKPDIVLEIVFPNDKKVIWLFDAKYRLNPIKTDHNNSYLGNPTSKELEQWETSASEDQNKLPYRIEDGVPDDAINQMHRYRDALIRITQDSQSLSQHKSRPVFGAFALYPGYFDQEDTENPYRNAITEIGIGAFALLPSAIEEGSSSCHSSNNGNFWLLDFLRKQVGENQTQEAPYNINALEEQLYVQEAARIPYYGMKQVLYPDLTMTVALAGQKGRDPAYISAFENGTANWYHLPQKTFLTKYKLHVVSEIRYLALAVTSEKNSGSKQIDKLWPVKKVVQVPRHAITGEQAGKVSVSNEPYYLFELGKPLMLKDRVTRVPHRPIKNSMKLTTLTRLESVQQFDELDTVYGEALA
ncbi:DUF2357 domain-containing protein [Xenorhabdus entomophaga]|uniref:DUF2357 domain-containing protein n=1 Tax=Xenorhabdus entomophaga TaxID=3136257 RepID=UPI0030F3AD49